MLVFYEVGTVPTYRFFFKNLQNFKAPVFENKKYKYAIPYGTRSSKLRCTATHESDGLTRAQCSNDVVGTNFPCPQAW